MAALYPVDFGENPRLSSDWLLVPGLSLWTAYRLEINPVQGYLALEPIRNSNYSEADFAFIRPRRRRTEVVCRRISWRIPRTVTSPRRPKSCSRWGWRKTLR